MPMPTPTDRSPSASASQTAPGSGRSRALVLAATAALIVGGLAAVVVNLPELPSKPATPYRIVDRAEYADLLRWVIEMPKDVTKTEIEAVARFVLTGPANDRVRMVQIHLGPVGPFNPTYASARLEAGQSVEDLSVFFHMH
jgi:hypothetical protein